jgi:hypothetical protein
MLGDKIWEVSKIAKWSWCWIIDAYSIGRGEKFIDELSWGRKKVGGVDRKRKEQRGDVSGLGIQRWGSQDLRCEKKYCKVELIRECQRMLKWRWSVLPDEVVVSEKQLQTKVMNAEMLKFDDWTFQKREMVIFYLVSNKVAKQSETEIMEWDQNACVYKEGKIFVLSLEQGE